MFDEDEILRGNFYGTDLPGNAACQCHHPFRIDDGATTSVCVENQE